MSEEWPTEARIPTVKQVLQSLTENDYKIIALEATVAQQAAMIEHLRGGLGNDPRLVSYAEDMSTCTLTTGDGTGYFYDRIDADQPTTGYTAVDMANAARDGFRDGAASVVVDLPAALDTRSFQTIDRGSANYKAGFNSAVRLGAAAIIAAGGRVKE